jgi:eukaryotic-like serine/threonine-protein kinase
MNSPAHPWIGRCLGDNQRYRIDKRLGGGGMGDVFLAIDTRIGQQVALKLLKDTLVESSEMRQRFEREITISAALPSEHIVNVSDCGVTPEGYPFYVMEYLRGESLGDLLRRERRIGLDRTVKIITQICSGLLPAHQGVILPSGERIQAVVHRDLKPDNIFLLATDLGERVKIVDFGIAKLRNERSENLTLTNTFLGTLRYSSPEQMMGDKNLDGRADIYSLGIMMYEMLSGADPFGFSLEPRRVSEASWIVAHTQEQPKSLRSHPDCELFPPALEELVLRCLAKDPQQRFQSVAELSQSLQAIFAAAPDRTRVQSRPDFSGNLNPTNPPAASKSVEPAATIRRTPPSQPSAIEPPPVAVPDPSIARPDYTNVQPRPEPDNTSGGTAQPPAANNAEYTRQQARPDPAIAPVPPPAASTPASASIQPLTPAVVNPTPPPTNPHHQTTVQPRPEQQPTPPPPQPSPQKKAIDTRVKIAVGAVIGLGLAGGIYTYLQARSRTIVDEISGLNQQKNYAQCVAKAEETGTNGSNDRVQEILNECRLAYALELKEKDKLVEAINMVERIPKESPLYNRAQQYAKDWRIL